MTTVDERLARLEGTYEHLATKADVAVLKSDIANLKADPHTQEGSAPLRDF